VFIVVYPLASCTWRVTLFCEIPGRPPYFYFYFIYCFANSEGLQAIQG